MKLQSGFPYSLIRYGLPYTYPKLESDVKTEVVIVGGGISGALSAYHLQKAGISCVVVDGRTIGLGSTCASTSLIQYEIDVSLSELTGLIGEKKPQLHTTIVVTLSLNFMTSPRLLGFQGLNSTEAFTSLQQKRSRLLKKEYNARKHIGLEVDLLEEREIKERFGFDAYGAILSKNAAYADAYLLSHQILQASIRKGLQVYDRTFISKFSFDPRSVTLTTAEGKMIKARKVIFATGYEVTEQISKKIVDLHSTYVTISESMSSENPFQDKNILIWNTADPYLYMRSTQDGRIIVGGRDETFNSPARRDKLIARKSRQLVADYKRLFPNRPFNPEFTWTGTFGSTRDGLPFIGTYGNNRNRYFALGFGGNGITFSVIAADMICELILGKKPKHAELYSFDRV